ncbi:S1 family peptidase [Streptomyces sp. NPDC050610]|uniref:S1 family peptidase n=1 Tax=Streptomyces sp. NPDC050610 TaxID=3157097 RepID=UPI003441956A
MSVIRARAAGGVGLLAAAVAASLLVGAPANAVVGASAKDGSYPFTAKLDIGGQRSCSAALVEQQWLVTAASCFADNPAQSSKVGAGAPKLKTTATIGRADLERESGSVVDVVELVPRADRDLAMAKLAHPVTGITPARIGFHAPLRGEEVWSAGYGRTTDEWVPGHLHYAKFTVGAVKNTSVSLAGKSDDAVICQGDTGGPAFRDIGGRYELVGINSLSWQGGCLGNKAETRRGAVDTRLDDIAGWVQATASQDLLSRAQWQNAAHMASGHFTSVPSGDKRRMDLFVVWKDGSASLFQGADHDDPKQPFSTVHQIAKAGSYWKGAQAITGGSYTAGGSDGITVRWANGKLSTYTHVDQNGVHDEKTLFKPASDSFWKNARLITAGRYTDNPLRDDLLVLWENGSVSMYTDTGTKGLDGWKQLHDADKGWTNAAQLSSGEFTGKKTDDLVIRWKDGDTTIFPGVDTNGFHGRTRIRPVGSPWKNAEILTVGAFTTPAARPDDILIRWANGNLGYYPHVDADGTHDAIPLVNR